MDHWDRQPVPEVVQSSIRILLIDGCYSASGKSEHILQKLLGRLLSLTNADTLSIFRVRSCSGSRWPRQPSSHPPEKTNPPTIIPKHAMTGSTRVVALISVPNRGHGGERPVLAMYLSLPSRRMIVAEVRLEPGFQRAVRARSSAVRHSDTEK